MPATSVILALGAHPDDIEFGCGGVIAQAVRDGHSVHFVVCSRGESGTHGSAAEREAEAREGAKLLGASIEFVDFGGDAHLEIRSAHALALARIVRKVCPRHVLAPTVVSHQHPDHAVIGQLARDAARLGRYGGVSELRDQPPHAIDHLLHYAITVEGEPAELPLFFDVSAVMSEWTAAMQAHRSQLKTRDYVDLQLQRARLAGLRCGVAHATALYPADPLVFSKLEQLPGSARRF